MRLVSTGARRTVLVSVGLMTVWAGAARGADCPIAISVCSQEDIAQIPMSSYSSPDWFVQVTSSGYSDFAIVEKPPFPRIDPRDPGGPAPLHELLSGELATAISYNGMMPRWTERCFRYPDWEAVTDFMPEQPPTFPDDPDGDGFLEGWSSVANPDLRLRVDYDWEDTGTGVAMGRGALGGATYELSNRFVLHLRYTLENISTSTLNDVSFYQLAHFHPANAETPTADIVYDDTLYNVGAHASYRFDMTARALNSGLVDGYPTGSMFHDHVSISTAQMPTDSGLNTYKGHVPGDDGNDPSSGSLKPTVGSACDVEFDLLGNETMLLGEEVAGAMKWSAGDLAPGATTEISLLMSFRSVAMGIPAPKCLEILATGGDPEIRISPGLCKNDGVAAGPYDIVKGSLFDVGLAPGCGKDLNCVALPNLACVAQGHGFSRISLGDDVHPLDSIYYLVRPSAPFSIWGTGNVPGDGNPWWRVYASPLTSSGVDACQPMP
jgi:hypothetical protein